MSTELDQDRLRKLVGMMSSDNAGERANAAQMFVQALGRAGLSHGEIAIKKARVRPPRDTDPTADIKAEARRYVREANEYFRARRVEQDEWDAERADRELETSARNFVRVMERMREETRLLNYEIAVLQTFVSSEVIRIAKSRVEIEKDRVRQQRWGVDAVPEAERTYPKGPGGKPGWVKDKASS